ncbi:GNAT family N-acetyltransferase [Curtobacterium sp. MCBD17_040]|uniref:GNAT family N-acetyltransferase n=1 Tax=Curtobacterium sp. MCBD17_040 TaxID=2175674 RepID=UPI000DA7076E|nr:GNAT family N-acetyltransferase [Curtobacterium sp. MCBD17_040]WIB64463.1 GNAT family N-acetyltransferase [Curtobacterium sp. MCBD17_040]
MVSVRAVPADLPDVDVLLDHYLDERAATFPVAQGSYRRKRTDPREFVPPHGTFVVAHDGEDAVGCGGLRRIDDDDEDVRFEVKHVFVEPAARGAGVATAIMDALERAAVDLGATSVVLDTNDSLVAAGAMYRGRGYERIAPYNDNPNATAWYRRRVG